MESITASCGLQVMVQETFPDPSEFDYIVVVGGLLPGCLELPDQTYRTLDRFASALLEDPDFEVAVRGYTDSTGVLSYNMSVSLTINIFVYSRKNGN